MKFNLKNRNIQKKYRTKIAFKNKKSNHTLEAVVVISLIVVFFLLEVLFGNIFMSEDKNSAIIEQNYYEEDFQHEWMQVLRMVDDELENKYNVYSGVSIDFYPGSIKIIIKTTLKEKNVENEKVLEQMNKTTNKVIESQHFKYQNKAYEIIITSEGDEIVE